MASPPGAGGREAWEPSASPSASHPVPIFSERDVSRTDRTNKFYEGPENPGLGLLNDILLTYCMYHFDLGAPGRRVAWAAQAAGPRGCLSSTPAGP